MSEKKILLNAINLAKRNLGITGQNPSVGCVIVKDKEILASAVTATTGRPHAETIAIDKIKDKQKLRGATIYVSLEPCCHHGKTAPCTDKIIQSGIKKVVIAAQDPDSRVNGQGIKKLQDSGIEVVLIELDEAKELYRGFFKARKTSLPLVCVKFGVSLDGKIALKNRESKWITSEKSREFSHYLRSVNDGILIGAKTLQNDNPRLDCRISGLENHSPKKFVIGNSENFDRNFEFFKNGESYILSASESDDEKIITCQKNRDGKIDLEDALKKICGNGVNSLLVEGGQNLTTNLLQKNLVDEIVWMQSNKIIGEDGISAIGALGFEKMEDVFANFKLQEIRRIGDDDSVSFYRKK